MNMQTDFACKLLQQTAACPTGLRSWNGSDPAQRFAVYRNNAAVSLQGALADNYPVTRAMLGDDFFRVMAQLYSAAEPPRSALLKEYGESFATFIEHFPAASGLPYLGDLARLEWLYLQAFHAADAESLAPAELAGLLADEVALAAARLTLHPALRVLQSGFAVVSLWAAHQQQVPALKLATVNPALAESALLMRCGLAVQVTRIEEGAAAFIANLQQGLSLADSVSTAQPFELIAALELLIRSGAIIGFRLEE